MMVRAGWRGDYRCRVCRNARQRKAYAAKRRERLKARRRRIAGRRRPPRVDCIWAAGHFEGEGTVSIVSNGARPFGRPVASLCSTDFSMVDVFQTHWPGHVQRVTHRSGRARDLYVWRINTLDGIECFLLDIKPFLKSERVRVKAALLLQDVRERAELLRTPQVQQRMRERHMKMRSLNKRGRV